MTTFTFNRADTDELGSVYRPANARLPLFYTQDISTDDLTTAAGDNDLKSILASIFTKIASHNSDGTTEASIESAIARALDYNRWKGEWAVNTRYLVNEEVKNGSNYFRRRQTGVSGSGDEPTQTSTTWLLLGGLDLEVAQFHEAVINRIARITTLEADSTEHESEITALQGELSGLETDIQNQIRAFASHQEVVVHELPDPTEVLAPEYAYLSNLWKPEQGFDGHTAPIPYSPGEYWNTAGTANRLRARLSSTTVDIGGTERTMRGFFQRAQRLQHHGLPIVDFGEVLHNPVGGAVPGLYFGRDPGNPLGLAASWQCWVKTALARHSSNPWNLPANVQGSQFVARVYHGTNQHFDIPFGVTITRTVDGVDYTQANCGSNPQPGAAFINGLDLTDEDASTIEVEFRTSGGTVLWLGDETRGWTWVDPEDNPTAVARIDKIQRASMWQGELLASISRSGAGTLDEETWNIEASVTGVTGETSGTTAGTWSHYLYLDCDEFAQSLNGSNGILLVVDRAGAIVSSSFIPWSMFSTDWEDDHEFFAGKWDTGGTGDNKVVWMSAGVNANRFHLRVACSNADGDSTLRVYRNN